MMVAGKILSGKQAMSRTGAEAAPPHFTRSGDACGANLKYHFKMGEGVGGVLSSGISTEMAVSGLRIEVG
jgi:hypothetical protein